MVRRQSCCASTVKKREEVDKEDDWRRRMTSNPQARLAASTYVFHPGDCDEYYNNGHGNRNDDRNDNNEP